MNTRTGTFLMVGLTLSLPALSTACRVESADRAEALERARRTGYRGILMENAPPKPDFTLTDTEGKAFSFRAETDGYVTLLFFGYTNCPDICPVHLASISAVLHDLPVPVQRRIRMVFVTTDPERDTPDRLRTWLDNFDRSFVGLTGPAGEVDSIQLRLGLPPAVRQETEDGGHLIGHASQVMAFSPDDRVRVIYPFGTRQADWKHDLPKLAGG
jgi:protein SCO1/2